MNVIQRPSPNFSKRKPGSEINCIVLHYTASATAESALSWFDKPESQVSSHWVLDVGGTIYQCVDEQYKAWHAGKSRMPLTGEEDINQFSIGIEIVNTGSAPYPPKQIDALIELMYDIMMRNRKITMNRIVGHSDICSYKKDPGPLFPWDIVITRLREELDAVNWEPEGVA